MLFAFHVDKTAEIEDLNQSKYKLVGSNEPVQLRLALASRSEERVTGLAKIHDQASLSTNGSGESVILCDPMREVDPRKQHLVQEMIRGPRVVAARKRGSSFPLLCEPAERDTASSGLLDLHRFLR